MKKIKKFYLYLYYLFYQYSGKNKSDSKYSACFYLSFFKSLILGFFLKVALIKDFIILNDVQRSGFLKFWLLVIVGFLFLNWLFFVKSKRYIEILEYFEKHKELNVKRDMIFLLILGIILMYVTVLMPS